MRKAPAFTIVEVMIVTGILAILLSFLLPALSKARRSASLVKCQSNLCNVGVAVANYASINRGQLYPFTSLYTPLEVPWPQYFFGDSWRTICLCPTGSDIEVSSYMINDWLRVRGKRLGSGMGGASASGVVLGGEHRVGLGVYLSEPFNFALVDQDRHGNQTSNTLWLDFHVDTSRPVHPWSARDPWSIP